MNRLPSSMAALLAAVLLAACGGSDDDPAPTAPDNTVPASAQASPEAYAAYVGALAEDDRREPLSLAGVVPPTSETAEPVPLTR